MSDTSRHHCSAIGRSRPALRARARRVLILAVGLLSLPAARAQTTGTALVRHAPSINGTIDGSTQQMLPESVTLNGGAVVTGDLLVPGTPTVRLNGNPTYGGTVDGTGDASPSNYQVTLNGNVRLGHVVRRTAAFALPGVSAPPSPAGTRNVVINSPGQSAGDFATLRSLTLNGNVGQFAVPGGSYGDFTANGGSGFTLGLAGATQPAVYNFQRLTLNGQTQVQVLGPIVINLAYGFTANGTLGTSAHSEWLTLNVYSGGFTLNGGCSVFGFVNAPNGTVIVNGNSQLIGGVTSDRLSLNGGGLLRLQVAPLANQSPIADAQSVSTNEDTAKAIVLTGGDSDGNPLTFILVAPPTHGALSGAAPNLTYTPALNYAGPDAFTFKVNDGTLDSTEATISLNVTPVNDAPTATAQSVPTNEDTALTVTLTGTDVENSPLNFSVVTPPQHGTLTPHATLANSFTYTPAPDYFGPDSFTFKANDGELESLAAATVSISITAQNDAPVATGQNPVQPQDTPFSITLSVTDVDGDTLTYTIVTSPTHGGLNGTAPNLTYTPALNYRGNDSLVFKANDGQIDSNQATINFTMTPVSHPPVASSGSPVVLDEDTSATVTLPASDLDGNALSYFIVTPPQHGTLGPITLNAGVATVSYTPTANYNGSDSFSFRANDGASDSNVATISIILRSVNDAPTASAQPVLTLEDTPVNFTLTATDVDGDPLTYVRVTEPARGTLSGAAPNLTYTPAANYNGSDSFTFKARDTAPADSNLATVSITVTPVNDFPVALGGSYAVSEGSTVAITLAGSDVDGDPLAFQWGTSPSNGTLTGTAPNFVYHPNPNFGGIESATFTASDGQATSAPATITINVTNLNFAPVANGSSPSTDEDTPVPVTLAANDQDGDPLVFSIVTPPQHGTLGTVSSTSGSAATVTYTPAANYNGADSFTFKARDTASADSNVATVSLTVRPINDAPVADAQSVQTDEDTPLPIQLRGSDVEGSSLTYAISSQPQHGTFSGTAPNLTYTPAANYHGTDSFTFKARDTTPADSNVATISITVVPVNDPPAAVAQSVAVNNNGTASITLAGTDVDGDTLSFLVVAPPAHGTLSGTAPNLTYAPAASYVGADVFSFAVTDGHVSSPAVSVNITVTAPPNAAPVVNAGADVSGVLVPSSSARPRGSVILDHDEWTFSDFAFSATPSTAQYARNVAKWFTGGRPGRFLAYTRTVAGSEDVAFTGTALRAALEAAGHTWTASSTIAITLENLQEYDGVFLAGVQVSNPVLVEYVNSGGCVYVGGGTKTSGRNADVEAGWYNLFLNSFGLAYGYPYNDISGIVPVNSSHPIFAGVTSLYFNFGNPVSVLNASNLRTSLVLSYLGRPLIAVYSQPGDELSVPLAGTVTDDGLPAGSSLQVSWSRLNGPETVTFANAASPSTAASFTAPGVYELRLAASDGAATGSDSVVIALERNNAPVVFAGPDRVVRNPADLVILDGTVADDGRPAGASLVVNWAKVSGPGTVGFGAATSEDTSVTVSAPGTYVLRLTASDGQYDVSDLVELRVGTATAPPIPDLAAWWSGNGHAGELVHGSHTFALSQGVSHANAKVSQGFAFNGTNGFAGVIGHADLDVGSSPQGMSVEFWFNPLEVRPGAPLVAWTGAGGEGVRIWQWFDSRFYIIMTGTDGVDRVFDCPPIIPLGQWTHVAVTYDRLGGLFRLFIDGVIRFERTVENFTPRTSGDIVMGGYGSGVVFRGALDEIALYRRALSAAEVLFIVAAGEDGKSPIGDNLAPAVNAGPDLLLPGIATAATLHWAVSDDNKPLGPPVVTWTKVAGPGNVTFTTVAPGETQAAFTLTGTYLLKLTASDGLVAPVSDFIEVRTGIAATRPFDGISAWWPGNAHVREVVNGNAPVELFNGAAFGGGRVLQGFAFDGANDHARARSHPDLDVGTAAAGLSIEFWLNPTDVRPDARLVSWSGAGGEGVRILQWFDSRFFVILRGTDGVNRNFDLPTVIPTGQWSHITITYDRAAARFRLYVNGSLAAERVTESFVPLTTGDLYVGGLSTGANFRGSIDELALYRRPLSGPEVYAAFSAAADGKVPLDDNLPPVVSAGPDLALAGVSATANLIGVLQDDLRPFGPAVVQWSTVSGPGSAQFANPASVQTTATFPAAGTYLLRLQASDGLFAPVSDVVEVRVGTTPPASPAGIAAWWPANGHWRDIIIGNHDVEPFNGLGFGAGKVLQGFGLDGSNDYGRVKAHPDLDIGASPDGLTIEFWFNPADVRIDIRVLSWATPSTEGIRVIQWYGSRFYIVFRGTDGVDRVFDCPSVMPIGQWSHVAIVYDRIGMRFRLHVNGSQTMNSATENFVPQTHGDFFIGGRTGFGVFNGGLDEVTLYKRPLSGGEIAAIYAGGLDGKLPPVTNAVPFVNAGASREAYVNVPITLLGSATDDGLPVPPAALTYQWSKVAGPGGVAFATPNAPTTNATFAASGSYVLRLTASDSVLTGSSDVVVAVTTPASAPPAIAFSSPAPGATIPAATYFELAVHATDPDGSIARVEFFQGVTKLGEQTTPEAGDPTSYFWPMANGLTVGSYSFTAKATDNSGTRTTSTPLSLTVVADPGPPHAEYGTPGEDARLTKPTTITGVAASPLLAHWKLEQRLKAADGAPAEAWNTFANGTTSVGTPPAGSNPSVPGPLGTFDPTSLLNGIYELRLTVADTAGRERALDPITVVVEGNMKIGAFSLAFEDLKLPVAGIPITITRTYDSRDTRVGDFGPGWRLALNNIRVQKNRHLGTAWWQTPQQGSGIQFYYVEPLRDRIVTVVMPDGESHRFKAGAYVKLRPGDPDNASFAVVVTTGKYRFYPIGDTTAKLEPLNNANQLAEDFWIGGTGDQDFTTEAFGFDAFNPKHFRLTTKDGTVFILDEALGLLEMRDLNGNTLALNRDAQNRVTSVVSSQATPGGPVVTSIAVHRDATGRVDYIRDPAGKDLDYLYDTSGRLASFTNRELNVTQFGYENPSFPFYLTKIVDPRGVTALRSEYDTSGRMVKQIDADGKETVFTHQLTGPTTFEKVKDRLGNETTFFYDARGNVTLKVDPLGGQTSYTYDANDNQLTMTDPLGHTSTTTYDTQKNVLTQSDALGHTTTFAYNALSLPLTITDARGKVTTNTYDAKGNLLTTTDPAGNATTFAYDSAGRLTSVTSPAPSSLLPAPVTTHTYTPQGYRASTTDALGHTTSWTYDANGNRLTQAVTRTKADNTTVTETTSYTYDTENRLTKTTFADGTFTSVAYNAFGKQASVTDQLGHVTSYIYDARGNLTTTTYADTTTESTAYDAENRVTSTTDRAGHTTAPTFDALGRATKVTYPDGTFTQTAYDAAGRVTTSTDARGNLTTFGYDNANRRTSVKNALNETTTYAYDNAGNLTSFTDALNHTTSYTYDDRGLRTTVTFPDATTQLTTYDALGRKVSATDQAGKVTRWRYDVLGRLIEVRQYLDQSLAAFDADYHLTVGTTGLLVTGYAYDEVGSQISQTDALGRITRYAYDSLGRRVSRTLPGSQVETYVYDIGGNLGAKTDFNGYTTSYVYDAMNRLTEKRAAATHPSLALAHAPAKFTYAYNALGQRTSATVFSASASPLYVESSAYDVRNRPVTRTTSNGTLSYAYDAQGNLASHRTNDLVAGADVTYAYDQLNRLAQAAPRDPVDGLRKATNYGYDPVGNLAAVALPNGVATLYAYDSLNRLQNLSSDRLGALFASYTYTLNATGHRTAVAEFNGRSHAYTYDALYRLTSETIVAGVADTGSLAGTIAYTLDNVGNRLARNSSVSAVPSASSSFDANDRLTSDTYDANGNTKLGTPANGSMLTSGDIYDFENRLIRRSSTRNSQLSTVDLTYDCDGHRVSETVGAQTITYLVDSLNPTGYAQVLEERVNGTLTRTYAYGHSLISQTQASLSPAWTTTYYAYDGHGSTRYLTDALGAVTDTYAYDAFGALILKTSTAPQATFNRYLYTGQQFDDDLGLVYLRARYMNPASGRFWNADSFEGFAADPQSLHRYVYANANPITNIDPSGRFSLAEISMVSLKIGIYATISGAAIGGIFGGIDAALDTGPSRSVVDGIIGGAAFGAGAGLVLAYAPASVAIGLGAAGVGLGVIGTIESAANGNYAQAAFRGVTSVAGAFGIRNLALINQGYRSQLLRMVQMRARASALAVDAEQGGKLNYLQGLGLARLEQALGRPVSTSTTAGLDGSVSGWGNIQLKGPFLRRADLRLLSASDRQAAIRNSVESAKANTAYDTLVIDTLGLTSSEVAQIQAALAGLRKPVLFIE